MAAGDNRRLAADWSDLSPAEQRLIWRHLSYLRRRRRPSRPAIARSLAKAFIAARSNPPTRRLVDWSHLPPDVLPLISRHLTSIWDYLCFRAVCSAADHLPRTPSLLLPYDPAAPTRSFLDPSDRRIHTIQIPEARGKWIYGTPHGWLVMLGKEEEGSGWMFDVSLLNPITGHQILLPSLPHNIAGLPEQQLGRVGREGHTVNCTKPVLTANPTSSSSRDRFLGLLIFSELALCKLGGAAWKVFDLRIPSAPRRIMVDLAYFDGGFYVVDLWKGITSLSTKSLKKQYSAPPSRRWIPNTNRLHLMEMAGDLLLLERRGVEQVTEVFKLDRSCKRLKWMRVEESIGDVTLFASRNLSAVSVPSGDLMDGGGDRICFAGYGYEVDSYCSMKPVSLCISDIVAGSSIGQRIGYWQGSRRACKYGDTLNGLNWIIPTLS